MARVGGWIFTLEEMRAWAARMEGRPVEDITELKAFCIVLRRLQQAGADMTCVVYPTNVSEMMVVTKAAAHSGWKEGDDPTKLRQFKAKEEIVKKALEKEGQFTYTNNIGH